MLDQMVKTVPTYEGLKTKLTKNLIHKLQYNNKDAEVQAAKYAAMFAEAFSQTAKE